MNNKLTLDTKLVFIGFLMGVAATTSIVCFRSFWETKSHKPRYQQNLEKDLNKKLKETNHD